MKSSKNNKTDIDEISRETQRLVSSSHVRLPYHKPKQKSLMDFLNRPKIPKECQASITGSKKSLEKAWEFIEIKEKNVEKFYNEDCIIDKDTEELSSNNDNIQGVKNVSLNDYDDDSSSDCDQEKEKSKVILSEISDEEVDEENNENNSIVDSELSSNDVMSSFNDDEEENPRYLMSLNSEKPFTQQVTQQDKNLENNLNPENLDDHIDDTKIIDSEYELKDNVAKQFIDDEAELSELDYSSDDDENVDNFIDESGDEEFSKTKKRRLIVISESSDDDDVDDDDIKSRNDVIDSDTEIKLTSDDLKPLFTDSETIVTTQQLMSMCSGQFLTQLPETKDDQEIEDDFDSDVPLNDADIAENEDVNSMLKLTSAKDFFDDEAELSESDWSSDEEHLVDSIDKLEEEAGDKDTLDEDVIKDGLDKIYMRQLLDDDQEQVSALKEMLLEDGELHSDSGRKRKFQWDEADQNDAVFKKPLFSDNEDDDENEEVLSDDEKAGLWRKERFKRESYLSQKNNSEDEEIEENEVSSDILQSSISFVKKTHVVKYQNDEIKKMSNINKTDESVHDGDDGSVDENDQNSSTSITVITDTVVINENIKHGLLNVQVPNSVTLKHNQFVKGSFMKRHGDNKMANTLLFINKKSSLTNNDEMNSGKYEDKNDVKSLSTITAIANNPFAYLLRKDMKQETKNVIVEDLMNTEKKENTWISKPCNGDQSSQKCHQTKSRKSVNSILKQLE